MSELPASAKIVIVGGGVVGCSVAYHLGKMGLTDTLLLERGKLTCGSTWHAAGLVGQMRPNRTMTAMSRYGIELYAGLEKETGLATGWKQCGSVNVAATPERLIALKRTFANAASFGVAVLVLIVSVIGRFSFVEPIVYATEPVVTSRPLLMSSRIAAPNSVRP